MTADLPDPHACPHCGFAGLAVKWGETICGMCNAPRATATPGCPVRNAMADAGCFEIRETFPKITAESIAEGEAAVRDGKWITLDQLRQSIAEETARERRVHGGGPRINQGFQP